MKTIKDYFKRKSFFDMTIENYYQNYEEIVKHQLNRYSKSDLIRFTNYLVKYHNTLYVDINEKGELYLFSTKF